MANFSIPSNWTKDDFAWAAFSAQFEDSFDMSDVLADVVSCLQFGFTYFKRNFPARFDWSLMQSEVDLHRSGYYKTLCKKNS